MRDVFVNVLRAATLVQVAVFELGYLPVDQTKAGAEKLRRCTAELDNKVRRLLEDVP